MTKLIADMSMSLDGKIATPDDDITPLAQWFFSGDTEVGPFRVSEASAKLLAEAFESVGALIGGRRYFDLAEGWGGRHPMGVPVYILTHEPPADWPADSTIRFVTDGLESAVAQATEAAGGKDIGIATPGLVRQCLDAGAARRAADQRRAARARRGPPYFDGIERHVQLEGPEVIEGTGVTHLRYRVARLGRRPRRGQVARWPRRVASRATADRPRDLGASRPSCGYAPAHGPAACQAVGSVSRPGKTHQSWDE